MVKCAHTSFRRGTHVFVMLHDGETFDDHYVEKKSTWVVLRERGRVMTKDIRSMSFFKNETT